MFQMVARGDFSSAHHDCQQHHINKPISLVLLPAMIAHNTNNNIAFNNTANHM